MEGMEDEIEDIEEDEEMEDDDDGGEDDETEVERAAAVSKLKSRRKPRSVLTGRGVTLAMLLDDGIMDPGEKCLSIDYLGQKFVADLQSDGRIRWPEANQVFNSPSAWAIYCKRLVNPSKKSGCGWASVKYKGKKLDQLKTTWFRKQNPPASSYHEPPPSTHKTPMVTTSLTPQPSSSTSTAATATHLSSPSHHPPSGKPPSSCADAFHPNNNHPPSSLPSPVMSSPSSSSSSLAAFHSPTRVTSVGSLPPKDPSQKSHKPPTIGSSSWPTEAKHMLKLPSLPTPSGRGRKPNIGSIHPSQADARLSSPFSPTALSVSAPKSAGVLKSPVEMFSPLTSPTTPGSRKRSVRSRQSVKYTMVTPDSDPHTLVELVNFSATGKMQPFSVDLSTNCLLLMDYHCHLTGSEVTGYLAGQFDPQTHHMRIVQAFPCRCRFADKENAPKVEEELQNAIAQRGLMLVGWYHSHPTYQPDPSIQDIQNQLKYQKALQCENVPYGPCLGIIVSPYDSYRPSKESTIRAFWIQASPDNQAHRLGVPMLMNTTLHQDQFLTQDLLNELRWMWSFYKGSPDTINFQQTWHGNQTYLDKVKASLIKKFPTDQTDGRFLEFINTLLS